MHQSLWPWDATRITSGCTLSESLLANRARIHILETIGPRQFAQCRRPRENGIVYCLV